MNKPTGKEKSTLSRRDFLQGAGLALGSMVVASLAVIPACRQPVMSAVNSTTSPASLKPQSPTIAPPVSSGPGEDPSAVVLFHEDFDDADFFSRGWYDGKTGAVDTAEHIPGSIASLKCRFPRGAVKPIGGAYAFRHLFTTTDSVYVSFWVKHSADWVGSGKPYHPHLMHLLTNLDSDYVGPSDTHLTAYIEENRGYPQLGFQDGQNIDEANINRNLIGVTEDRSTMGCNGTRFEDGHTSTDCYLAGPAHLNGTVWRAPAPLFFNPDEKTEWHFIEAFIQLNNIAGGIGQPDGIIRYWYDGRLLIDHGNIIMRTGSHPAMKFNQFLIAPYIGDGSPVDQTIWFDSLTVAATRVP